MIIQINLSIFKNLVCAPSFTFWKLNIFRNHGFLAAHWTSYSFGNSVATKVRTSTSKRVKQFDSIEAPTRCQKSCYTDWSLCADCIFCPSWNSPVVIALCVYPYSVVVPTQHTHIITASENTPNKPELEAGWVRSSTKLTSVSSWASWSFSEEQVVIYVDRFAD